MPHVFADTSQQARYMIKPTPREAVEAARRDPRLPDGDDERFVGCGVMGVPFASGHYLALRDLAATSIGPAYRTVWHRTPAGEWTIHTNVAPELSCPRYFGAVTAVEQVPAIAVAWTSDWAIEVRMGERLTWRIGLARTPATGLLTRMGGALPPAAWTSDAVLASMGPMAGWLLRSGRIRLRGATPNGPQFKAAPLQVWRVTGGSASYDGIDFGELAPLPQQTRLADFWLPQQGLFFVGSARFTPPVAAERADRAGKVAA